MRLLKLAFAASLFTAPFAVAEAQYFSAATAPTKDDTPFYDVDSDDDGAGCNIGYVLTGTDGSCKNRKLFADYVAPYDANFTGAWFAHANGNVDATVGFKFFAGAGANIRYFGGVAGATPLSTLAIRDLQTNTILHLFSGAARNYTFNGPGYFDIGIATFKPASGGVPNSFSWSNIQPSQFAAFGNGAINGTSADCGTGCWVGAEDIALGVSDYDYNDGMLRITGANVVVPEPSSALLLVGSLAGLAGVARRRKQA